MGLVIPSSGADAKLLVGDNIETQNGFTISPPKNYIKNPDFSANNVDGWTNPGTGFDIAASSSSPLRGAFSGLISTAGGTATEEVYYAFTIDAADKAKPLSISFDFEGGTGYDAGDARVRIFDVTNATYIDVATIPGGSGTFRNFFVTTTSTSYRLVIRDSSGSAFALKVDNFYVGPQTQLSGAAVTDPVSFTPTGSWTTNSTYTGKYRQVGNYAELQYRVDLAGAPTAATLTFNLPTGLVIDTTAKVGTTTPFSIVQNAIGSAKGGGSAYTVKPKYNTTTSVTCTYQSATTGAESFVNATAPVTWASGDYVEISFTVPIVGWTSNVTMAERAVEEYAWNSSATTTSDTTSFANGPNGVLVQAFAPSGNTAVQKRVRFQTNTQATDSVRLELKIADGQWTDIGSSYMVFSRNDAGTTSTGVYLNAVNSTDYDVQFFSAPFVGGGWASESGAGLRWRVRKVSSGAAVGYPVGARNVVGDVTGTAVPTGYLGETLEATQSALTSIGGASLDYRDVVSLTLTPGKWSVTGLMTLGANAGTNVTVQIGISSTAGNAGTGLTTGVTLAEGIGPTANYNTTLTVPAVTLNLAVSTVYYLKARSQWTGAAPTAAARLTAVRIA